MSLDVLVMSCLNVGVECNSRTGGHVLVGVWCTGLHLCENNGTVHRKTIFNVLYDSYYVKLTIIIIS